jgi:hypothetical protein
MYNANMFGLNMIKGFLGMSLVMKLVHSGSKIFGSGWVLDDCFFNCLGNGTYLKCAYILSFV